MCCMINKYHKIFKHYVFGHMTSKNVILTLLYQYFSMMCCG